jgi:hypothetical protein
MSRPTTQATLLDAAAAGWDKLWLLIGSLTDEDREASFAFDTAEDKEAHWRRDRNLRDVLAHLHEWHLLLLRWVEANTAGHAKPFLPAPYTWKTYGELNQVFWEQHQATSLDHVVDLVRQSHDGAIGLIQRFTDQELFTKKHFAWTGTTSLGSYCVSATSSHYDWAMKKIKRHAQQRRTEQLTT